MRAMVIQWHLVSIGQVLQQYEPQSVVTMCWQGVASVVDQVGGIGAYQEHPWHGGLPGLLGVPVGQGQVSLSRLGRQVWWGPLTICVLLMALGTRDLSALVARLTAETTLEREHLYARSAEAHCTKEIRIGHHNVCRLETMACMSASCQS
jgi:hypothetical protein